MVVEVNSVFSLKLTKADKTLTHDCRDNTTPEPVFTTQAQTPPHGQLPCFQSLPASHVCP